MNHRKHILEAVTLIVAAVVIALVANAFASRERKLVVVSNTTSSTPRTTPRPEPAPVPTTTTAPEPAPVSAPKSSTQAPMTPTPSRPTPLQPTKSVKQAMLNAPAKEFNPHPDKPYIELHGDDVAALHSKGVLFLDARRTSVYEQGHIPGARPFSVWESDVDDKVNKLYAERPDPKDQNLPIVIYCSGGDCEDSHMLAQKLWGIGFNNAYVYKDGFPDWQKRGEPVHTGANP